MYEFLFYCSPEFACMNLFHWWVNSNTVSFIFVSFFLSFIPCDCHQQFSFYFIHCSYRYISSSSLVRLAKRHWNIQSKLAQSAKIEAYLNFSSHQCSIRINGCICQKWFTFQNFVAANDEWWRVENWRKTPGTWLSLLISEWRLSLNFSCKIMLFSQIAHMFHIMSAMFVYICIVAFWRVKIKTYASISDIVFISLFSLNTNRTIILY